MADSALLNKTFSGDKSCKRATQNQTISPALVLNVVLTVPDVVLGILFSICRSSGAIVAQEMVVIAFVC